MKAIVTDGDIVSGFATGDAAGVDLPSDMRGLPAARLRVVDGVVVDVAELGTFHIDAVGLKHAVAADGRQPLACAWDDELVRDGDEWGVRSASEILASPIKAACHRRILAVASTNTQMNLTAARAAGRLDAGDAALYEAGLDWIDDMRARCAELIAAASPDYDDDSAWPAVPAGLSELCARY